MDRPFQGPVTAERLRSMRDKNQRVRFVIELPLSHLLDRGFDGVYGAGEEALGGVALEDCSCKAVDVWSPEESGYASGTVFIEIEALLTDDAIREYESRTTEGT